MMLSLKIKNNLVVISKYRNDGGIKNPPNSMLKHKSSVYIIGNTKNKFHI